ERWRGLRHATYRACGRSPKATSRSAGRARAHRAAAPSAATHNARTAPPGAVATQGCQGSRFDRIPGIPGCESGGPLLTTGFQGNGVTMLLADLAATSDVVA